MAGKMSIYIHAKRAHMIDKTQLYDRRFFWGEVELRCLLVLVSEKNMKKRGFE